MGKMGRDKTPSTERGTFPPSSSCWTVALPCQALESNQGTLSSSPSAPPPPSTQQLPLPEPLTGCVGQASRSSFAGSLVGASSPFWSQLILLSPSSLVQTPPLGSPSPWSVPHPSSDPPSVLGVSPCLSCLLKSETVKAKTAGIRVRSVPRPRQGGGGRTWLTATSVAPGRPRRLSAHSPDEEK